MQTTTATIAVVVAVVAVSRVAFCLPLELTCKCFQTTTAVTTAVTMTAAEAQADTMTAHLVPATTSVARLLLAVVVTTVVTGTTTVRPVTKWSRPTDVLAKHADFDRKFPQSHDIHFLVMSKEPCYHSWLSHMWMPLGVSASSPSTPKDRKTPPRCFNSAASPRGDSSWRPRSKKRRSSVLPSIGS